MNITKLIVTSAVITSLLPCAAKTEKNKYPNVKITYNKALDRTTVSAMESFRTSNSSPFAQSQYTTKLRYGAGYSYEGQEPIRPSHVGFALERFVNERRGYTPQTHRPQWDKVKFVLFFDGESRWTYPCKYDRAYKTNGNIFNGAYYLTWERAVLAAPTADLSVMIKAKDITCVLLNEDKNEIITMEIKGRNLNPLREIVEQMPNTPEVDNRKQEPEQEEEPKEGDG